jgi:hypothetical protein
MIRAELLQRISSLELSKWMALQRVRKQEEDDERDQAESGDGIVHRYGRDREDDDELTDGDDL